MKENKLHITVASANGDWEDDVTPNKKIHALKVEAMAHLKMEPGQADKFELSLNGQPLDENKTLEELNVPDGSVLILQKKEITKI